MFAEADSGIWVGVGTAAGIVIGAISGAVVAVVNARQKVSQLADEARSKAEDAAAVRWSSLFDRQEHRITLLESNSEQAGRALQESNREHARCLVRYEELWGWAGMSVQYMQRQYEARKTPGLDIGPPPPLPRRSDDPDAELAAADFRERTVLHDTATLKKLDAEAKQPHPDAR